MRSLENLTTLNSLSQSCNSLVENKLLTLLNEFNELLASCKDEYDYFSLMVATEVFGTFAESQFRQDLLDSSPEEMEDYIALKKETATKVYKKYLQEVSS